MGGETPRSEAGIKIKNIIQYIQSDICPRCRIPRHFSTPLLMCNLVPQTKNSPMGCVETQGGRRNYKDPFAHAKLWLSILDLPATLPLCVLFSLEQRAKVSNSYCEAKCMLCSSPQPQFFSLQNGPVMPTQLPLQVVVEKPMTIGDNLLLLLLRPSSVAKAGLKLVVCLPQPFKCWDYRNASPHHENLKQKPLFGLFWNVF